MSAPLTVSCAFPPGPDTVAYAQLAESLGYERIWLYDSPVLYGDVWVHLARVAAATTRIGLGPAVLVPHLRHPVAQASAIATVAELAPGRLVVAIGTGFTGRAMFGKPALSWKAVREYVTALRAMFEGRDVPGGKRFPTRFRFMGFEPRADLPIYVAGLSPNMLRLAGEVADGVILMGAANPELTSWQLSHVATGAAAANRKLDDVTVDLWFTISLSDDRDRALADVRPWAVSQARWFHRWKQLPDALQPWQDEFRIAAEAHDFGRHLSRHADGPSVSDEFVDWIGVAGDLDHCVEKIRPLLDLKVDRITFALLPGGRLERLQRYGAELIPGLRTTVSYEER